MCSTAPCALRRPRNPAAELVYGQGREQEQEGGRGRQVKSTRGRAANRVPLPPAAAQLEEARGVLFPFYDSPIYRAAADDDAVDDPTK